MDTSCPYCGYTLTYDEDPCPGCGGSIEWVWVEPELDKIPNKPGGWKPVKIGG